MNRFSRRHVAFLVEAVRLGQWVLHNGAAPSGGVAVLFSPNAGRNWVVIVLETIGRNDAEHYQDSVGTFTWTIPDSLRLYGTTYLQCVSDECMVQVGAPYDEDFLASQSEIFSVDPAEPTLVRPLGVFREGMGQEHNALRPFFLALDGRTIATAHSGAVESPAAGIYVVRSSNSHRVSRISVR